MSIEQMFGYMQLALTQIGVWGYLQTTVQVAFILGATGYLLRFFRSGG